MLSAFPLFLSLLFSGEALGSAPPRPSEVPRRDLWLEVTPARPGQPARVVPLPNATEAVHVEGVDPGPAVLCTGGDGLATLCRHAVLVKDAAVPVAWPVAGVRVTGRVLVGKNPAAGAVVGIVPRGLALRRFFAVPLERKAGKLVRTLTCDEQGRFTVPLLAPGEYQMDIRASGGRIDQSELFVVPDPDKLRVKGKAAPTDSPHLDLGEMVLADGVRVEVSVTDTSGQPVARAGVGAGQERPGGETTFFETRSNAAGQAALTRVDAALPLGVTCLAPGYVRLEQRFDTVPALVRCVLNRLSEMRGTVIDGDDKPVRGATVSLRPDGLTVQTGPDGGFQFVGLRPGAASLTVSAPGFRAISRQLQVASEERKTLPPVALATVDELTGTVVDGISGKPIPGAAVRVREPPGGGSATTGDDGVFTLKIRSERSLGLDVEASRYPVTAVEITPEKQDSAEPLRVALLPGGRIAAEVWDEQQDAPCAGCALTLQGATVTALTTGADGTALSPLLAPGRYSLGPDEVQTLGSVIKVRGGHDLRSVTVEPDKIVTVRFGERRQRIQVVFSPPAPPGWHLRAVGSTTALSIEPSADGTFLVRRPRDEELTLFLDPPAPGVSIRQAVLPADGSAPVATLSLFDSTVTGRIEKGGTPAASEPLLLVSTDGTMAAKATTDDRGAFSIPFVPPGTYSLVVGQQARQSFEVGRSGTVSLGTVHTK